ncbi:MAG: hypothetical protein OEL79_00345 [Chromatiales bacterium]|nr:hypothetical protein [Chromatiales bacterium]
MKNVISLTLILGITLYLNPLYAADEQPQIEQPKKESISLWEALRKKIETLTPKKRLIATTAVGGVRGALIESEDLYWKGERIEKEIDAKELKDFENAITLYESGNAEGAKNAFSQFISAYPKSTLIADANTALTLLQTGE